MALRHVQVYTKETEICNSDCRYYPTFDDSEDDVFGEEASVPAGNYCALDLDDSDDDAEIWHCAGRYAPLLLEDVGRLLGDELPVEFTDTSQQIHTQVMISPSLLIIRLQTSRNVLLKASWKE